MAPGRFESAYTDTQLLKAAGEVLQAVAEAGEPASQRVFNEHREPSGHPDLPRADSVAARLGISWSDLIQMQNRGEVGTAISLGKAWSDEPDAESWITRDQAAFALRLAALRLGQTTLTSADYRRERENMGRGSVRRVLPTDEQILDFFGTWGEALRAADLAAEDSVLRELDRIEQVHAVLDSALEAHGEIPSQNELVAFARANGLPLPDRISPYEDVLRVWRLARDARGLATPDYRPGSANRPDFGARVLDGPTGRVRRGYWTEERAVAAVRRFLDSRSPGQPTSRKAYVDWQKGDRDAPSASHLDKNFGGFARIRRLAART